MYLLGKFFLETPGGAPNEEVNLKKKARVCVVAGRFESVAPPFRKYKKKKGRNIFIYVKQKPSSYIFFHVITMR